MGGGEGYAHDKACHGIAHVWPQHLDDVGTERYALFPPCTGALHMEDTISLALVFHQTKSTIVSLGITGKGGDEWAPDEEVAVDTEACPRLNSYRQSLSAPAVLLHAYGIVFLVFL